MFQPSLERTLDAPSAKATTTGQRGPVHRPRRLQGRQRHPRPRGRRRAARRGHRADLRPRSLDGPGGPARRRRVRHPDRGRARPGRSRAMAERLSSELRAPYVIDDRPVSSPRASASPARATPAARPTWSATPTSRCTWPRPTARAASPSSTRACTPPSANGTSSAPSSSAPSSSTSCASSTSPSSTSRPAASPASRRSSAGSIPSAGSSPPAGSSRSPRRTAPSCRSGAGSCARPAAGRPLAARGPRLELDVPLRQRLRPRGPAARLRRGRRDALREAGLEPADLMLEITETALLKATPSTIATLDDAPRARRPDRHRRLRDRLLLAQPPAPVPGRHPQDRQRVRPGRRRRLEVGGARRRDRRDGPLDRIQTVAEGIETREQAARMRALGCTYGQGFFFATRSPTPRSSRPSPPMASPRPAQRGGGDRGRALGLTPSHARPRLRAVRPSPAA